MPENALNPPQSQPCGGLKATSIEAQSSLNASLNGAVTFVLIRGLIREVLSLVA